MKRSTRIASILAVAAVCAAVLLLWPPIPQAQEYHDLADQRAAFGIPHFLNVVTSLAFVLIGGWALVRLFRSRPEKPRLFLESAERWPWFFVFLGTCLAGIGSAVYHWAPSNETLLWDRLPIAMIPTALLAAVVSERISVTAGIRWLAPLLVAGIASVLFWAWGESRGAGDLRFYGLVHYLPLLLIPLLILLFPPRYTRTGDYFVALGWYLLAKIAEGMDAAIFGIGGLISGHTLKHLFAAFALFWLFRMITDRALVPALRPFDADARGGNRARKRKS